jgi:hypothetical protein
LFVLDYLRVPIILVVSGHTEEGILPGKSHTSTVLQNTLELHESLRHQERASVVPKQNKFIIGKSPRLMRNTKCLKYRF